MSNALLPMDTRRQLLRALKTRYQAASKAEKTRILEEFILISGYHRKSAIRLLNGAVTSGNQRRRSAATRSVYGAAVQQALIVLWEASEASQGLTAPAYSGDGETRASQSESGTPRAASESQCIVHRSPVERDRAKKWFCGQKAGGIRPS
ncbi:hypothetical protein AAO05_22470 [Salmonella enterica subsp. enterica serovar Infantis]|nr:hypothetical protein [Salmonella enterica subsp. enterica serovar Infantis]